MGRASLDRLVNGKSGVDADAVRPDGVVFYLWPRAADAEFDFVFRLRFAIRARTAPSVVYGFCNPDERLTLAPVAVTVQQ